MKPGINEVLLSSPDAGWIAFRKPVSVIQTHSADDVLASLRIIDDAVTRRSLHAAGFVSYEAAAAFDEALVTCPPTDVPLVWFGLYEDVETVDLAELVATSPYTIGPWVPSIQPDEYRQAINRIKDHIACGETYQVNFSFRLRSEFSGSPWSLFLDLVRTQGPGHCAFLDTGSLAICSASPELFFRQSNAQIVSRPMKGTAARGKTLSDDLERSVWLKNSEKNRAENLMIVDMVRNDIGRVAQAGSVDVPELFAIERYPTVLQMTSTVSGRTDAGLTDVLSAMFPCASITGAPKASTMRIIAELETSARGIYTGCIGYYSPGRHGAFNVAIRTVAIKPEAGTAEYGVGGGIVWDSEADSEYEECRIKSNVLMRRPPRMDLLETILWEPESGYFLLEKHLARVRDSAEYFGFTLDIDELRSRLSTLGHSPTSVSHKVRVTVSDAGGIAITTGPIGLVDHTRTMRVALAPSPVDASDVFLYHKTTHRDVYETALLESQGCDDVILWNSDGEITESTIANVVVRCGDELLTPPVESGLLAGTFRQHLLETGVVREAVVSVEQLRSASDVFLVNSVRRWVSARLVAYDAFSKSAAT